MPRNIRNMMNKTIETIEEMASIQEAANKMKEKNVSSLVVVDNQNKPQSIVTERDLVRRACVNDIHTSAVSVKEIMSSPIITIDSDASAAVAVDMMLQDNVRHLLVVDTKKDNDNNKDSKPIGIITSLDLSDEEYTDEELKNFIEELSAYYR